MNRMLLLIALCATVGVPAAAFAQAGPGPGGPPPPTAEQRATMEKLRSDAKTSAYNALTPAHRDRVTAIVADVAAGRQDRLAAAKAIDDLLTPDEQKAVRDAAGASFRALRAAMMGGPGVMAGPPQGGPAPGGRFAPSAGRFLLMVSLSRDQMRTTQPRARSTSGSN